MTPPPIYGLNLEFGERSVPIFLAILAAISTKSNK